MKKNGKKKYKLNNEKLELYWKEKKEFDEKNKNLKNNKMIKAINKSLEERETNKIIKSLDRSRSSLHHQDLNKSKKKPEKNIIKIKLSLFKLQIN